MRGRTGRWFLLGSAVGLLSVGTGAAPQTDDELINTFRQQVGAYVALHERLERALPPLVPSEHAHVIAEARRALANAIGSERVAAQQGDIFTPPIAALFRRLVADAVSHRDVAVLLLELNEEFPEALRLTPEVNRPFPPGVTHEVPVKVLHALPPLTGDIEYRLVGRHLVLWDLHANLIVDYVPYALVETT